MRVATLLLCAVATFGAMSARSSAEAPRSKPIKIAVFRFELEDVSPAASYVAKTPADEASAKRALQMATNAAREELARSGRYTIVPDQGVSAKPLADQRLRDCHGCEAAIARKLGAQESMLGIVRRATQTDYYIVVLIRDARTGKIVNVQSANFAGGEEGWANGAMVLIRYQVLPR